MPIRMGSRSCPALKSDKTRHSKYVGIVGTIRFGARRRDPPQALVLCYGALL